MKWNSIGIPNIPKIPVNIGNALISFSGAQLIGRIFGDKWGIFNQRGIPLLLADNVVSVRFEDKSQVAIIPVENGGFAGYNKVNQPYKASVLMTKADGGVEARGAFLALLDTFANSTDLYMIITPEAVYPNCAIIGYDYIREAGNGARMIKVNVHFQEVRLVNVEYRKTDSKSGRQTGNTETKSESGRQVEAGNVQANPAPAAEAPKSVRESWLSKVFG